MIRKDRQVELFGQVFAGVIDTWEGQGFRVNEEQDGRLLVVEEDRVRVEIEFRYGDRAEIRLVAPAEIREIDHELLLFDDPGDLTDRTAILIGNTVDQFLQRAIDVAYPTQPRAVAGA
ncbi:hypothetical protein JJB07_14675 [Tumebacillus sp. ITR2]|uniref:DUF3006 domain-containing protein n=1 Tax=Tumebacillus amylolyticus TaxID=2801339 RepID=A0ABS1JE72_9BACL|nr:hypothetical protein [Tumebacillus amylolyticus]MBL0387883.1 hypothetical protein [Tumebacillus amylolyticus]